jgi:hypothetical protein
MIQPELPLATPPARAAQQVDVDWRLDERTRCVGRRGVAAARALLAGVNERTVDSNAGQRGQDTGAAPGQAGRAA